MSEGSGKSIVDQKVLFIPLGIAGVIFIADLLVSGGSGIPVLLGRAIGALFCMLITCYIVALVVWFLSKKNKKAATIGFAVMSGIFVLLYLLIFLSNFLGGPAN